MNRKYANLSNTTNVKGKPRKGVIKGHAHQPNLSESGPAIIVPRKPIEGLAVYTDGSAMKNGFGGPGTWAFVIVEGDKLIHEKSSWEKSTTNNRMEMSAVLAALVYLAENKVTEQVVIHMDSSYVYNGCTDWIHGWHKKGYKRDGNDIPNRDLWQQLYQLITGMQNVQYKWVKGHANNKWNCHCDELCTQAYETPIHRTHVPDMIASEIPIVAQVNAVAADGTRKRGDGLGTRMFEELYLRLRSYCWKCGTWHHCHIHQQTSK